MSSNQWEERIFASYWSPDPPELVAARLEEILAKNERTVTRGDRGRTARFEVEGPGDSLWTALLGKPTRLVWTLRPAQNGSDITNASIHSRRTARRIRTLYVLQFCLLVPVSSFPLLTWARQLVPGLGLDERAGISVLLLALLFLSMGLWSSGLVRTWKGIVAVHMSLEARGIRLRRVLRGPSGFANLPQWFLTFGVPIAAGLGFLSMLAAYGILWSFLLDLLCIPEFVGLILLACGLGCWLIGVKDIEPSRALQASAFVVDVFLRVVLGLAFALPLIAYAWSDDAALTGNMVFLTVAFMVLVGAVWGLFRYGGPLLLGMLSRDTERLQSAGEDAGRWEPSRRYAALAPFGLVLSTIAAAVVMWTISGRAFILLVSGSSIDSVFVGAAALVPAALHLLLSLKMLSTRGSPSTGHHDPLPIRLASWAEQNGMVASRQPRLTQCIGYGPAGYLITRFFPFSEVIFVSPDTRRALSDEATEALLAHELGHAILHRSALRRQAWLSMLLWSSPAAQASLDDFPQKEREADGLAARFCEDEFGSHQPLRDALLYCTSSDPRTTNLGARDWSLRFSRVRTAWIDSASQWKRWGLLLAALYATNALAYIHVPLDERLRALSSERNELD